MRTIAPSDSKLKRMASVAVIALVAAIFSVAIAEARPGGGGGMRSFGGGGGGPKFSGGGGPKFSGGKVHGFSGLSMRSSRFSGPRTMSPRTWSGGKFSKSAMFRSGSIKSFSGLKSASGVKSARSWMSGKNGAQNLGKMANLSGNSGINSARGISSLKGNMVTGSVAGAGKAAMLKNSAFASAGNWKNGAKLSHAAFRGKFANQKFANQNWNHNWHGWKGWNNWNNWHGGWWWNRPIIVIGWFGGLFWPFAYWDFVDYTFWPYAYDAFWPYAYDDLYVGMFGPYAYEGPAYTNRVRSTRYARRNGRQSPTVPVVCSAKATALTDWPIQQITELVQPDQAQQAALNELKDATAKAVDALQSACPDDLPSTPTGRLAAMDKRIATMLLALSIVEPPMKRFYDSLSDEQKARFNTANTGAQASSSRGGNRLADLSQKCGEEMMKTTIMPTERIVRAVNPTEPQRNALNELNEAANKAAEFLKANCSTAEPMTPTSRVVAMEQRLQTMSKAIRIVEPALQNFYGLLTDEQKARFNQLGSTGS